MAKEVKTNAMRILDQQKVPYTVNTYVCDAFIDGVHIADLLHQDYGRSFKTLVTVGKSKAYYVFVLPIAEELDMKKCARAVGEKAVEMLHVKDILAVTGYIRGGCSPLGMKKSYRTVLHNSALSYDRIIISGGRIGAQIELNPRDLVRVTRATVAAIIKESTDDTPV